MWKNSRCGGRNDDVAGVTDANGDNFGGDVIINDNDNDLKSRNRNVNFAKISNCGNPM